MQSSFGADSADSGVKRPLAEESVFSELLSGTQYNPHYARRSQGVGNEIACYNKSALRFGRQEQKARTIFCGEHRMGGVVTKVMMSPLE